MSAFFGLQVTFTGQFCCNQCLLFIFVLAHKVHILVVILKFYSPLKYLFASQLEDLASIFLIPSEQAGTAGQNQERRGEIMALKSFADFRNTQCFL